MHLSKYYCAGDTTGRKKCPCFRLAHYLVGNTYTWTIKENKLLVSIQVEVINFIKQAMETFPEEVIIEFYLNRLVEINEGDIEGIIPDKEYDVYKKQKHGNI